MRDRDPFKRAGRRIVRRFGRFHDIKIRPPDGEWLKVDAVFNNPVLDVEVTGGGKSGQDLQMRQPHVVMETRHCDGCEDNSDDWTLMIDGREYYIVKAYAKDDAVSYLFIADQPDQAKESSEGEGRGRTWY